MSFREFAHPFSEAGLWPVLHGQVFEESTQVLGEISCAGIAVSRVECQALRDEGIEAPGNFGAARFERGHLPAAGAEQLDRVLQRRARRRIREWMLTG